EIFPMHAKRIAEAFEQLSSEELTLLQKTLRKITNETK
ncbi:MarR family transcriptional regulator, partial [Enterococcus faecalis]